ncbi:peptidoglycan-binding protein [Plantactinospora sp. S1510]|uniref:Peptidoglycan-binding protein n=2 Tax=Plantactinospora alkalitolerans TaxID=2789879 RepID=A0ABS0GZM7_9ACTN|nr:peptidoglycan-binding protein [Plantactinospora alkalitolerans]
MAAEGKRRRRRGGRAAIAAGVVIAAGAAAIASTGVGFAGVLEVFGGKKSTTEAGSTLPPATATITRETLVDAVTLSGDLGFGSTTSVFGRLTGTVTWLPGIGSQVVRGKPLYRLDNKPVVLMYGRLPMYRALKSGDSGADVKQFEQNLSALGYDGFTVDNDFTSSTASAVREWQDDLGLSETGTVDLGRVFYASGQIRVDSQKLALGNVTGPGSTVLTYTGNSKVVSVELPYDYRQMAKKGAPVTVTLPDGETLPGKISSAVMVIKPAASSTEKDTTVIEVSVTANDPKKLAGLDEASLEVAFASSERKDVLTVPVAALLALSEGGYGVQLVEGDSARLIAVKTGLFANGKVEITGDGLAEGATVGMPA